MKTNHTIQACFGIFACLCVLILAGGCRSKVDGIARPATNEHGLQGGPIDSFLTIQKTLAPHFAAFNEEFDRRMPDFEGWMTRMASLCEPSVNKLVFEVMVLKGQVPRIDLFLPICQAIAPDFWALLRPLISFAAPRDMDEDEDQGRLAAHRARVQDFYERVLLSPEDYPPACVRMADQTRCGAAPSARCMSDLFERYVPPILDESGTGLASSAELAAIENYFEYFDARRITAPISRWRYYEYLANIAR